MKKLLTLTLALLMLLTFVGCGKDGGESSSAPTTDAIEAGVVALETPEAVFEEGTTVTAETVTAGEIYERAKTAVKAVVKAETEKFTVYEFNAVKNEAKVQPNGKLAVTFRIPEDYSTNVKILYVADDGTTEEITATVNAGERTVVAELAHFSTYVLIDLGEEETTTTTGDETTTSLPSSTSTTAKPTTTTTAKKPTTTTTTAKPTTTTTTAASYSAFKSHDWMFRVIVEDGGKFCHTYTLVLTDGELRFGESAASPYEEMTQGMTPEEIENADMKVDYEFGGIQWCVGAGGGDGISAVTEKDNVITVTDLDGKTLVLQRTGEKTAKVVSNATAIGVKAGDVFTVKE